ncbi:MAG: hypothetical protein A3B24_02055 [Candidatus Wildermuthbacteria bacterium RIFCSPLOWO2_01_FULL_48_16]|uniref:Uncharacterized protein n=1 Tax=Candidatus Wildermuthbacteria bacterium RIFCSPLOWO2_01_FULL_48_16 TaxID=1802461 RepID=A0A1G2RJA5_9BACT|nr:MAG: hypothetical protein A3B24_02055 [Candidatus Wildermuthbacteria bacterium RIFCSPLOWO2_01_FULL_48_16]
MNARMNDRITAANQVRSPRATVLGNNIKIAPVGNKVQPIIPIPHTNQPLTLFTSKGDIFIPLNK